MIKQLQYKWKTNTISFDPYKIFFGVIFVHILALTFGIILLVIQHAEPVVPIWTLPFISLGAVSILLNLGNGVCTAKEIFWVWIIFSVSAIALAFYGKFLMEVI